MEKEVTKVTKVWDSNAEEIAYRILKRKIYTEKYQISKHVALKEIFRSAKKETWMNWHVDFLIEDLRGYPILGIEINGIEHWNDPKCKKIGKMKKILFEQNDIPLVCIPLPELPFYTKEEYKLKYEVALEDLMNQYLAPFHYRTSYPAYCYACGLQLAYKFKKDHTAAFYCCINKECKCKTIPAKTIPVILV
ncbi:MAG: hypothetical protein K2N15_07725 [Lachnospiraceae bacterium]|nr:hypothetical protein [Lachnospiraceae bacterium]